MRTWSHYLGGGVMMAGLLGLATRADGESCSLELKKVDTTSSRREHTIFRATYPQHFSAAITEGIRFGGQDGLPKFADVIKREPDNYQASHPVRGVLKLGSQHYGYVLDSSVKETDPEEGEDEDQKKSEEADDQEKGGLLSQLGNMFFGSKKEPKEKKAFQVVPYDRLYFDRNHNGDLTDEKVVEAQSTDSYDRNYYATSFARIDVPIEVDSTKLDYAFTLRATAHGSRSHAYLSGSVNSAAYREGEITLGGKRHRLVLLDYNSNGRFDDEPAINTSVRTPDGKVYATQGDRLYIDPDLKKRSRNPYGPATDDDLYDVSRLIHLDGRFYELTVAPAGDWLSLDPSDTAIGFVSNPNQGFRAVVYGEKGFMKVRGDDSGKAPLPTGQWKLQAYTIYRTDISDRTEGGERKKADTESEPSLLDILAKALGPTMAARAPRNTSVSATATMKYQGVEVKEGETAVLPFGPPYRPAVDVQYRQGAKQVSLGLSLLGTADEICSDMQIEGKRPGKPNFTIATADGDTVAEDEFEYG